MSTVSFQPRRGLSVRTISSESSKTDLVSIWGSSSVESSDPPSSPNVKNHSPLKSSPSLIDLLSISMTKSPKKTLYVPPRVDSPALKKVKPKVQEFMYSSIVLTSPEFHDFESFAKTSKTYVFKGMENQEYAWEDFKKVVHEAKQSIVATPNLAFHFKNNVVVGKALTSSAQNKLDKITENSHIEIEKAINLLDDLSKTEKLCIYSTHMFNYSVVTPVMLKHLEMDSNKGKLHRYTLNGCVFPSFYDKIMSVFADVNSVKRHNIVLH